MSLKSLVFVQLELKRAASAKRGSSERLPSRLLSRHGFDVLVLDGGYKAD